MWTKPEWTGLDRATPAGSGSDWAGPRQATPLHPHPSQLQANNKLALQPSVGTEDKRRLYCNSKQHYRQASNTEHCIEDKQDNLRRFSYRKPFEDISAVLTVTQPSAWL